MTANFIAHIDGVPFELMNTVYLQIIYWYQGRECITKTLVLITHGCVVVVASIVNFGAMIYLMLVLFIMHITRI